MKGGCERRHSPHNNSPGATESAYEPDSRSPHTEQSPPAIGRIAERQSSQTGKREMLTRGWWQISQSEGNNVANKAAATPLAPETKQETNRLSRFTLVSGDRFWVPLLLKTILPRPTDASGARIGRILFSIAMPHPERNDAQLPLIGITLKINSRIPSCVRTWLKHPTSVIVPKVYDSNISGSAPFENWVCRDARSLTNSARRCRDVHYRPLEPTEPPPRSLALSSPRNLPRYGNCLPRRLRLLRLPVLDSIGISRGQSLVITVCVAQRFSAANRRFGWRSASTLRISLHSPTRPRMGVTNAGAKPLSPAIVTLRKRMPSPIRRIL